MRNFIKMFLAAFMIAGFAFSLNAQSVGINSTGEAPNSKAILDLSSTTQGFLPPRMTYAQRVAITSPPAGLIVWCSNCGNSGELQVFNGTTWTNMIGGASSVPLLTIGQSYGGGKIAYILQDGDPGYVSGQTHGLIAADAEQSTGAGWGCYGTEISGADGTALGTGAQNTQDIVNPVTGCSAAGIAARLCNDLELNGYSDWYLPSKDELDKLYNNRVAIGGFADAYYWSSSEHSNSYAWFRDFGSTYQSYSSKNSTYYVRAIRAF